MELLILVIAAFVLACAAAVYLMLRDKADAKRRPKRPPTITEEILRNREINAKYRPKVR